MVKNWEERNCLIVHITFHAVWVALNAVKIFCMKFLSKNEEQVLLIGIYWFISLHPQNMFLWKNVFRLLCFRNTKKVLFWAKCNSIKWSFLLHFQVKFAFLRCWRCVTMKQLSSKTHILPKIMHFCVFRYHILVFVVHCDENEKSMWVSWIASLTAPKLIEMKRVIMFCPKTCLSTFNNFFELFMKNDKQTKKKHYYIK